MASKRAKLMWTPVVNVEIQHMEDGRVRARAGGLEVFKPTPEEAMRTIEQQLQQKASEVNY